MFNELIGWPLLIVLTNICLSGVSTALRSVLVEGDVMLGGLFPVHEAGRSNSQCGAIKPDQGLQRMIAM